MVWDYSLYKENAESLTPLFSSPYLVRDFWWKKCELRDVIRILLSSLIRKHN
jgi:hypothetical protein